MAVPAFHGNTFVAFTDISGFKAMMNDGERAVLALDAFYQSGYSVLRQERQRANHRPMVHGFFVSDCAVLFVTDPNLSPLDRFQVLCSVLQQIHRRTFQKAIQLTTSIAWGQFDYEERIEFLGINKDAIYGGAYVDAFMDNEHTLPKLYPNECRLLRKDLPVEVERFCVEKIGPVGQHIRQTQAHFYYEWMREL